MAALEWLAPLYGGGFLVAFSQLTVFYYIAGAILHWGLPRIFKVQSVQVAPRKHGSVEKDALFSIGPLLVKAAVWVLVERLYAQGGGKLYSGPVQGAQEILYMLLVIAVLDYLHDAWFYWTHRLLHWGPLYRHVHYIHHKHQVPNAFTGYSFHVIEAAIVFANEYLVCFLFPIHMGLHRWYHLFTTLIHEGGHVGYEISPFLPTIEGLVALMLGGLKGNSALNTVQHHDMHHRFPNRNFSLYFTHWDRWCGTLHAKYDEGLFSYFR